MKTYAYSYITKSELIVSGTIKAKNRKSAINKIQSEGIKILNIVEL